MIERAQSGRLGDRGYMAVNGRWRGYLGSRRSGVVLANHRRPFAVHISPLHGPSRSPAGSSRESVEGVPKLGEGRVRAATAPRGRRAARRAADRRVGAGGLRAIHGGGSVVRARPVRSRWRSARTPRRRGWRARSALARPTRRPPMDPAASSVSGWRPGTPPASRSGVLRRGPSGAPGGRRPRRCRPRRGGRPLDRSLRLRSCPRRATIGPETDRGADHRFRHGFVKDDEASLRDPWRSGNPGRTL